MTLIPVIHYTPLTPPLTFRVQTPVSDIVLSGIDTPEHGRLFDAKAICDELKLCWRRQRERVSEEPWGPRYAYHALGSRTFRIYFPPVVMRLWFAALDVTRRGNRTKPETRRIIRELLGLSELNDRPPPAPAESVISTDVEITGGVTSTGVEITLATEPVNQAQLEQVMPSDLTGVLVATLREISTTMVTLRSDQATNTALQRHMGDVLADHQEQLQTVRNQQVSDMAWVRDQFVKLGGGFADHAVELRATRAFARHAAALAEGLAQAKYPNADPTVSFDTGCRQLGVKIRYGKKREMSGRLRDFCEAVGYPVVANPAPAGHVYHTFDLRAIFNFLVREGYAPVWPAGGVAVSG